MQATANLSDQLKIYTVYHKPSFVPAADYLHPIQAGKTLAEIDLGMEVDNDGEQISAMNPGFCELTVLYNIWKNKKYTPVNYWGLCHYRRYFTLNIHWTRIKKKSVYYLKETEKNMQRVFSSKLEKYLLAQLAEDVIILPRQKKLQHDNNQFLSVRDQYCKDHEAEGWTAMELAIKALYPEYVESFHQIGNGNSLSAFNMMIAHHTVWDRYLTWLFDIVFYIQENNRFSADAYQSRAIGFMAERLLNTYFEHHSKAYKITYLPVANFM